MINYTEKGLELHEAVAAAGLSLYELDGVWVTDHDPVEVQAFIDAYQPDPLAWLPAINAKCEELMSLVKQGYPDSEVESWSKQETEARAGGGPLTDALAQARGIPAALLREKIIQKSDAFAVYSGQIIGMRQALEDRVLAGEIGVVWPE